jgi:hypothetical protein
MILTVVADDRELLSPLTIVRNKIEENPQQGNADDGQRRSRDSGLSVSDTLYQDVEIPASKHPRMPSQRNALAKRTSQTTSVNSLRM